VEGSYLSSAVFIWTATLVACRHHIHTFLSMFAFVSESNNIKQMQGSLDKISKSNYRKVFIVFITINITLIGVDMLSHSRSTGGWLTSTQEVLVEVEGTQERGGGGERGKASGGWGVREGASERWNHSMIPFVVSSDCHLVDHLATLVVFNLNRYFPLDRVYAADETMHTIPMTIWNMKRRFDREVLITSLRNITAKASHVTSYLYVCCDYQFLYRAQ